MRRIPVLLLAGLPLMGQIPDAALFKGDPKAALLYSAEKLRSLAPKDPEYLYLVGQAYLAAGERAKAEEVFQTMAQRKPKPATYAMIAKAWVKEGILEPVPALLEKAEQDPMDADASVDLAITLMDAGRPKEAEALMAKVHDKNPKDDGDCMDFGRACLRAGHADLALPWFQRAVTVNPKNEKLWRDAALALADHGLEH